MHMLFHGWFLPSRRSTFHLCSFPRRTQEPVFRIQRHHCRHVLRSPPFDNYSFAVAVVYCRPCGCIVSAGHS